MSSELEQVRAIALSLPEVNERLSHGAPSFFVRDKKPICYFHSAEFASDDRVSIWCPAPPGTRDELTAGDPERFFSPTPSASGVFRHWIGMFIDDQAGEVDWEETAEVIEDAFRHVAPKKLIAELDR